MKIQLKVMLCTVCCWIIGGIAPAQNNVGVGTRTPNSDAILELFASNKGLLQPRVPLVAPTNPSPLAHHVAGMRVYNTASNNDVAPGEYYNDGTRWLRIQTVGAKADLKLNMNANIELDGISRKKVPGLKFITPSKGIYLLLIKEFFNCTKDAGNDEINWYTQIYRNNIIIDSNETYRSIVSNIYQTDLQFFVVDLEPNDIIEVEILKPFAPHKLYINVPSLYDRTSLTAIKIF